MSRFDGKKPPPVTEREHPTNQSTGNRGEDIAVSFLSKQGYQILERNFRCKGGEVDIVARELGGEKSLVFVEVKTRRDLSYGVPQLAVTPFKQRQISKAALTWLSKKRLHNNNARFDVIAILLDHDGRHAVEHIINAFELAY
ncbi:MAG: YraN family protein [Desulfuromonadales bacterium]|nr:YraN family protein [Desulfuromonadales bacterium]